MGGMQNKLIEFDLTAIKELKQVNVEAKVNDSNMEIDMNSRGTCAILREHSRFVVSGDVPAGRIHLRDPLNLKVAHTLMAHSGMLNDFDVHGHHLVTCGNSTRNGIEQPDRFLMVYDLRILRAISPIPIHVPPYQLRFLPSMSSRIAVVSSLGQVQLVDTAALISPQTNMFQVNMSGMATGENCNTISMDISPSNQCLAFGDSLNELYLYGSTSVSEPAMNPFARETEFAEPLKPQNSMSIDDELAIYSKIPRPHLPVGQSSYASDFWPEKFKKQAFRPTPAIDSEILKTMKVMETGGIKVGYARNVTNMKRNQMQYPEVLKKMNNDQYKSGYDFNSADKGNGNTVPGAGGDVNRTDSYTNTNIPKSYRKIAIKLSKMGSDDFDFDRYNRTGFCGLEASLPNSYSNAMLQILYYTEKLRILLLNHTCSRENCICCELSFLFHMMDISPGMPCQSSNFLRALRTIAEASALGLVFVEQSTVWKSNVPRLVQSWNRFILQQINAQSTVKKGVEHLNPGHYNRVAYTGRLSSPMKTAKPSTQSELEDMDRVLSAACVKKDEKDSTESNSLFTSLLGIKQEKVNTCTRCKDTKVNHDIMHLCNLIYPDATAQDTSKEIQKKTLTEIICSSLCPEQTTPAWCDKCRKYQTTIQTRKIKSMPCVLSLNCGNDNPQDVAFWQAQHELLYADNAPKDDGTITTQIQQPPPNVKPCRYGVGCTRPDCKFWHPEIDSSNQQNIDIGAKCAKIGVSWIPNEITLHRHEDGKISYGHENKEISDSPVVETKVYDIYGVCSVILDPSNGQANNIVASINVGPTYHARVASPVSQWYIFNDFSINMVTQDEALSVNLSWKIPVVLFYQARELPKTIQDIEFVQPITAEVFSEDKSLTQNRADRNRKRMTFIPLQADEMPKKGDLVAIDAEFVTLNQEESELRSDGKVSTIKAAQMSVARITCVRGSGLFEGSPFIDDYISTQEQVVDYVTKFSGIKPGDLDANFSSKHLTTLNSTYKKLRYLIDTGCIFIGHGLKNDFKGKQLAHLTFVQRYVNINIIILKYVT